MQILPRFAGTNTASASSARPHQPQFGQFPAQAASDLGIVPKLALPVLIGGVAYLIHSQGNKMEHAITEMFNMLKEGKEEAIKDKSTQKIWNYANTGVGLTGIAGGIWTALKLKTIGALADSAKNDAGAAITMGHDAYQYADWTANNSSRTWRTVNAKPKISQATQNILDHFKQKAQVNP